MRADPFGEAAEELDAAAYEEEQPVAAAEPGAQAPDSPLAGLRRAYDRRRQEAELFLPVPGWEEPTLVARVTVPHDQFVRRLDGTPGTPDWMADFVAETVAGLFTVDGVDEDGTPRLEPLPGVDGALRFDGQFGSAIGVREVRTPRAAVLAAFTRGGGESPPVVSVLELADFAEKIERWLTNTSRQIAEAIVPGR